MNPLMRQALETAIGAAAGARHYEVTVEHLLLQVLLDESSDAAVLCRSCRIDRSALLDLLRTQLREMKSGNDDRPVFSSSLWSVLRDAWLHGSLTHGDNGIRSGQLLLMLIRDPNRHVLQAFPPLGIPLEVAMEAVRTELGRTLEAHMDEAAPNATPPRSRSEEARFIDTALGALLERDGATPRARDAITLVAARRERARQPHPGGGIEVWESLIVAALRGGSPVEDAASAADETMFLAREVLSH